MFEHLNDVQCNELTTKQTFLYARMLGNWGIKGVENKIYKRPIQSMKDAIELCEKEQGDHTCTILEALLDDTEMDHAYWLEKQLGLIDKMGLPNYIEHSAGHDDTGS